MFPAAIISPRLEIASNTGHTKYPVNDKLGRIVALWVHQFATALEVIPGGGHPVDF
jgi:hypothetical protein